MVGQRCRKFGLAGARRTVQQDIDARSMLRDGGFHQLCRDLRLLAR